MKRSRPGGRLLWKYALVISSLIGGVLLISSLVDLYFSYQSAKAGLAAVQRETAAAAAAKIEDFVRQIEQQLRWAARAAFDDPTAGAEELELGFLRLLRNVPVITEVALLDRTGKELLRVSRVALDVRGSHQDFSREPRFVQTRAGLTYFGPVYFRHESEPYMTIAVPTADERGADVAVAEVDLSAIWDVVSRIKVGKAGSAYVADLSGHLVAHPDISLVLQKRDLSGLPQVREARAVPTASVPKRDTTIIGTGLQGGSVVTTHATITPLNWLVFVEQPLVEAFEPLRASILRAVALFVLSLLLSILACALLARRMVAPIRVLQAGAARIGEGDLAHRILVRTSDEVEALADAFNRMTARLEESYTDLERKVQERTRELTEALEQQTGVSQILRAISSTSSDLQSVLDAVAEKVAQLSDADNAAIFRFEGATLHLVATFGRAKAEPIPEGLPVDRRSVTGRAVTDGATIHIHDFAAEPASEYPVGKAYQPHGTSRTILATPLLREGVPLGAILVRRLEVRPFTERQIELVRTFADQAVIAIEIVRLLQELQRAVAERELASRHKSQFLASMSHELRTPLNAILGFNELILSGVYGDVSPELREPLTDIQNSGKHLLGLINNVLDLAKIEAGRMELSLMDYDVQDVVERVRSSLHPLAADKGLDFAASAREAIPLAYGDAGRIIQCLLNLAGNALKFTRQGRVDVSVDLQGDVLVYRVADTGIGIAKEKIATLFTDFQQGDTTITSEFGGTGLGLSITKKFVDMHGGRIWVESELGKGSTFWFEIPLRLDGGKNDE